MSLLKRKIKSVLYKKFGKIIFSIESRKRKKINAQNQDSNYLPLIKFKAFEVVLLSIEYPDNQFNKIMSMVLQDIEQFQYITKRYRDSWLSLKKLSQEDNLFRFLNPSASSYPVHPFDSVIRRAIAVDAKSLFTFGAVAVNRLLVLLSMYFPEGTGNPVQSSFSKVFCLYKWLEETTEPSDFSKNFKEVFLYKIKWLHSAMRFYRNKFIEHLEKGFQQGTVYSLYNEEFRLTHYKWDYTENDDERIEKFRQRMKQENISISERTGSRVMVNRFYLQNVFNSITTVPYSLMDEALELIEEIGVESPTPERLISELEQFFASLFDFMITEFENSNLNQYKRQI